MTADVLSVVGARPQFVKAAAVSRALEASNALSEVMVHTGQHFDTEMSAVFFEELEIPEPRYSLDIHGGGHGQMTGRMLAAIEDIIEQEVPAIVLIYGDTNSTLAGALAAAKMHVPVAHVEAGLRSFNRRMPEEVNRVLADHISDLLFCPTHTAIKNLAAEGITAGVHHSGDVMYDATLHAAAMTRKVNIRTRLNLEECPYAVATLHRAENTESRERLEKAVAFLKRTANDMPVVFPIHPRTRQAAENFGVDFEGLSVCAPLGYVDMAGLVSGAELILTDSGGLQKEAYFHRVRCITLRDESEWVETIEAGWNRLWQGPDFLPRRDISEYGDGEAAKRVVEIIERTV